MHRFSYRALPLLLSLLLLAFMGVIRTDNSHTNANSSAEIDSSSEEAAKWREAKLVLRQLCNLPYAHDLYPSGLLELARCHAQLGEGHEGLRVLDALDAIWPLEELDSTPVERAERRLVRAACLLEASESALHTSERFSFGDMELRILTDYSEGLCAPSHSIAWGNGETLSLSPDWIVDPIESVTICDLDCDGDPELAITTACCGSGRYGELLLLEWTMGQWTPHRLCEIPDYATHGRMGHERITLWEDRVEVEFPLYNEEDANCCPTAGRRSISYIFVDDAFRFDRSVDGPASEQMNWQG